MSHDHEMPDDAVPALPTYSRRDLARYTEKFGVEKGLQYLRDGVSFVDALSREIDQLKAQMRSSERQFGYADSY